MAVRDFDGIDDTVDCAIGALTAMTHGTFAAIVKRGGTGNWHTILAMHDSSGNAQNQVAFDDSNNTVWWPSASSGPSWNNTSDWALIVVRKASGNVTPRFSVYNFTTDAWVHANGSSSENNFTAPGSGGTVRFRWQTFDFFNGLVAVRAAWSNSLPWSADTTGDAAIEAAGLETSAANWLDASPSAMWRFNQDAVTTAVVDDTGGGADQTARTGTAVVTGDDPPGFDFSLSGGANVDLTPAVINLTAVALDPDPQPVDVDLTPAVINFDAVTLDPDPQPVDVNLTPAVINFDAVTLDPDPQPVDVNLTPAVINFTAPALDPEPQPVDVNLTPAVINFDAVALDPELQPVDVDLTPAVINFTAPALNSGGGAIDIDLTPAIISFDAVTLDPQSQIVNIDLTPAIINFDAVTLDPQSQVVNVDLTPAVISFTAPALIPGGAAVNIDLTPAVINFDAVALDPQPQAVDVDLTPVVIVFAAVPLSLAPGLVNMDLTPAIIVFTAVPLGVGAGPPSGPHTLVAVESGHTLIAVGNGDHTLEAVT